MNMRRDCIGKNGRNERGEGSKVNRERGKDSKESLGMKNGNEKTIENKMRENIQLIKAEIAGKLGKNNNEKL